jgi:group I intron endonuclease
MGCVYKITSPSNNIYIGKSISFLKRIKNYKCLNCKKQQKLYNSFKKYGFDNHKMEILFESNSNDQLLKKEIEFIKIFDSVKNGLNITYGGEGVIGLKHSEESKIKISESLKGKTSPRKGVKLSEETKMKMSKSLKGRVSPNKGEKLSDEVKLKISKTKNDKNYEIKKQINLKISKSKKGAIAWNKGLNITGDHKKNYLLAMAKRRKIIIVTNKENIIIGEYKSVRDASEKLNISAGQISNYCTGRFKCSLNYIFKYKN